MFIALVTELIWTTSGKNSWSQNESSFISVAGDFNQGRHHFGTQTDHACFLLPYWAAWLQEDFIAFFLVIFVFESDLIFNSSIDDQVKNRIAGHIELEPTGMDRLILFQDLCFE